VFANRPALGYVLGYGAHCFELYGMRTWIVSFWVYVAARGDALLSPITLSVLIALLSFPSSILGNEVAIRAGRHRAITAVMIASTAVGLAIGWFANASPILLLVLVLIYAVTIPADSGALTSGMAMSADPANRGATMAMHSTVGFGLSALAGWAVLRSMRSAVRQARTAGSRCLRSSPLAACSARWRCGCRGARSACSPD
jgi:hypothetical protein